MGDRQGSGHHGLGTDDGLQDFRHAFIAAADYDGPFGGLDEAGGIG